MSNLNQQYLYFESPIGRHWFLPCLLLLILAAALVIVSFLNISVWIRVLIAITIISRVYFIWRMKLKSRFKVLIYERHSWFILDSKDKRSEYKLDKLSKVFNLAYVLNLRELSASDTSLLIVWKRDMPETFSRFLNQVHQYGLPNNE